MSIPGITRGQFEAVLRTTLSPTTPIRSPEFLRGREQNLEVIRRALVQPGRHIFIHGDRGVGKTSLAQTAAFEHQSASQAPILLGCDPSSTFYQLAHDLVNRVLKVDPTVAKTTKQKKIGLALTRLSAEHQQSIETGRVPEFKSMNDVVAAVEFAAARHSSRPVAIVDEFERITDPSQRTLFADFIKQLGDQSVSITLIFCGVGASLDELLDTHHSCYRYLTTIQLERLGYEPRFEIIDGAAKALGLEVDSNSRFRIAMISDGYPHYVHLLTEKLLWEAFGDESEIRQTEARHYKAAVRAAVNDIAQRLKAIYEKAILKYNADYEEVLWAVVDHHELKRRSSDIYDSYCRIMKARGLSPMSREKFNTRMNALKKPNHGAILKATRQGWYEFQENFVRGYVRLRAEERGVELGADLASEPRKALVGGV